MKEAQLTTMIHIYQGEIKLSFLIIILLLILIIIVTLNHRLVLAKILLSDFRECVTLWQSFKIKHLFAFYSHKFI